MTTWTETSKLSQLRSKTDRQLVEIVRRTLETAACFSRVEEFRGRAERACEEVRRLLPALARADRRRFESRLQEITEALHPRAQAACF
jgi:hypothetical protein